MSNTHTETPEPKKPTSGHKSEELSEKELEGAAGGINPQPLPPFRHVQQ